MSGVLEAVAIGSAAGAAHVLTGADHLAVVAPLAAGRGRGAWRTGLRWGLGHAAGVAAIGAAAAVFWAAIPVERVTAWGERAVGISLVAVGLWALTAAVRLLRSPDAPGDEEGCPLDGREDRTAFAVGILHGTAGGGHVLGVLPALAFRTGAGGLAYLLAFAGASVVAMAAYAAAMGVGGRRLARSGRAARAPLLAACALISVAVGGYWLGLIPAG